MRRKMLKILFAPDSFKGSLSAVRITQILEQRAALHFKECQTISLPVADGGEGTVDALVTALGGRKAVHTVSGPMGLPVEAAFGWVNDGEMAVIEMAEASGLPLMGSHLDPMKASSRGTGELIAHVIEQGAKSLLIGIGGSATNEGGMGMLAALGAVFYDDQDRVLYGTGEDLCKVARIELSGLHPLLSQVDITVICDVTNPLLGADGATAIYGPQKGVTAELYPRLEAGMERYAALLEDALGKDVASASGAGAAGGMGAALSGVLGARLRPGIDTVLETTDFDRIMKGCDLVITGEGRLDGQSVRFGKVPAGIASRCKEQGVPVIAIVGSMGDGAQAYYHLGMTSIVTTVNAIMPLETAISDAEALLSDAADRVFQMVKIGMHIQNKQLEG